MEVINKYLNFAIVEGGISVKSKRTGRRFPAFFLAVSLVLSVGLRGGENGGLPGRPAVLPRAGMEHDPGGGAERSQPGGKQLCSGGGHN